MGDPSFKNLKLNTDLQFFFRFLGLFYDQKKYHILLIYRYFVRNEDSVSVMVSSESIGRFGFRFLVSDLKQNSGFGCILPRVKVSIVKLAINILPTTIQVQ